METYNNWLKFYIPANSSVAKKMSLTESTFASEFQPSEAGIMEQIIDLNKELIFNPTTTFCVAIFGKNAADCGFQSGDILLVDRSYAFTHGSLVLAVIGGEFAICKTIGNENKVSFIQLNGPIEKRVINFESAIDVEVWGVITTRIQKF